jgi:hypothetical protein
MATSIREQIILAAVARITADAPPGVVVYRSREAALAVGQLPAVVMAPLRDIPSESSTSLCWLSWTFTLAVDVVTGEGLDTAADPIIQAIHGAMMATDRTLGLSAVHDVTPGPVEFSASNREQPAGLARVSYEIKYRTRHADITVAPS